MIYSQNSFKTFIKCPRAFKFKYIDKISWISSYEEFFTGLEFHLLCERYFSGIDTGLYEEVKEHEVYNLWMNRIRKLLPLEETNIYLPEYTIKVPLEQDYLMAKYDLLVIKENSIEIWDWKTQQEKLSQEKVEKSIQTKVYMYVLGEVLNVMYPNIDIKNINMNYYQPEEQRHLMVSYNRNKHYENSKAIKTLLKTINNFDYDNFIMSNKSCSYCEFKGLCSKKK